MREADTPEEKEKARKQLAESEKELKQDWGPNMPKGAGEAHHGGGGHGGRGDHEGGGRGDHEGGGHGGRGGGHGGRRDND